MKQIYIIIFTLVILFQFQVRAENKCVITYGMNKSYHPYEWLDDHGKPNGMNIDLLKAVSKESGCSYEIIPDTWPNLIKKLATGEINMMTISPIMATDPYVFYIPQSIVLYRYIFGKNNAAYVKSLSDLNGKKILVIKESYSHNYLKLQQKAYHFEVIPCDTHAQMLYRLNAHQGDFFMSTMVGAMEVAHMQKEPVMKSSGFPFSPSPYGFAVSKSNLQIYHQVDIAMNNLKINGAYFEILKKWAVPRDAHSTFYKYIFIIGGAFAVVFIFVMLWNKSLYYNVQRKTESLNKEITERISTEKTLIKTNEEYGKLSNLFQMVLDAMPEQIYLYNRKADVSWTNSSPDKNPKYFDIDSVYNNIKNAVSSTTPFELDKISDDAESWKIQGIILKQKENPMLVIISNVTENVRLRDETMMASRMAALGEMAASVAHEINNPSGLIVHNTDFIRQIMKEMFLILDMNGVPVSICGFDPDTAEKETSNAFEMIDNSLICIKGTIDNLKEFTVRQNSIYEVIDLKDCISSAVKLTSYFINKYTHNFKVEINEPVSKIYGNMLHLEQVIINLIQNSCHALTNKNQSIICRLKMSEDSNYMVLSVIDEGKGMSPDIVEKAFNAFFSTRKNSGGTGLGLAITSRIVIEHKGYYSIKSQVGAGTDISLFFPINKNNEVQA